MTSERLLATVRVTVLAAGVLWLFNILFGQALAIDEVEFYRASDMVRQGLVPYRDFWEHHVALQWFVFAPATALTRSPGAIAVLLMRVAQLPLWIATMAILVDVLKRIGMSPLMRWTGVALLALNGPFIFQATEFRIDAVSTFCLIAALNLALRPDTSPLIPISCGALLCLAGFANLRVMPLSLAIGALLLVMSPLEERWRWRPRSLWVAAGGLIATAIVGAYLLVTHSATQFWRYAVVDNVLTDRLVGRMLGRSANILFAEMGLNPEWIRHPFPDLAAMTLWLGGIAGLCLALRRWRTPGPLFFLAVVAALSLVFTLRVTLLYHYHLGLPSMLLVPLSVDALQRLRAMSFTRMVAAIAVIAVVLMSIRVVFMAGDADLRYQDTLMRAAHARSNGSDVVVDPVGWALRRNSAYRYWFVPSLVRLLTAMHRMEPYRVEDAIRRSPALMFIDERTVYWFRSDAALVQFAIANYSPLWPNLWIPGPNAVVEPGATVSWFVARDGQYAIHASPLLAKHPWFRAPFGLLKGATDDLVIPLDQFPAGNPDTLQWRVNGNALVPNGGILSLHHGDRLVVSSSAPEQIGVFVVPAGERILFRSTGGGDIDGISGRYFHLPSLLGF